MRLPTTLVGVSIFAMYLHYVDCEKQRCAKTKQRYLQILDWFRRRGVLARPDEVVRSIVVVKHSSLPACKALR